MLISNLNKNHTILARFPLQEFQDRGHVLIDANRNDRADFYSDSSDSNTIHFEDPLLHLNLTALEEFSELNETGTIYTKDQLGEVEHFRGQMKLTNNRGVFKTHDRVISKGTAGTLSELAENLNPFKNMAAGKEVEWAIEPQGDRTGVLYLFTDKNS